MVSRRIKQIKRLLRALAGNSPLNENKGPLITTPWFLSRKDRKHNGWITPRWAKGGGMKYREAIMEALEPEDFFDPWRAFHDGLKFNRDASQFKPYIKKYNNFYLDDKPWFNAEHINHKLQKELEIRRAVKFKRLM